MHGKTMQAPVRSLIIEGSHQTAYHRFDVVYSVFNLLFCYFIALGDSVCLACYVANGRIMVYSLPSLKLLLDVDFLALTDLR